MAARDDSFIRGSLITCMIFLALSLVLNFFLWRSSDSSSADAETASSRAQTIQTQASKLENQLGSLKAMLGVGSFTPEELEQMRSNSSDDPDMDLIEKEFARNMAAFGSEVEPQERNYARLPDYLLNAIRSKNEQYVFTQSEKEQIRERADAEIQNSEDARKRAEGDADTARKTLSERDATFTEDRERMKQESEKARDQVTKVTGDARKQAARLQAEKRQLQTANDQYQITISNQKDELNRLRNTRFESTQGEVRFVVTGGNLVTINLGAADQLTPGVTFGVIDADETRLEDARVKASIQVTRVQGDHAALARVISLPEIRNPIIPGDRVYSPFWAPGRRVKIALAGEIDIDDDGRPDNQAIEGQILAAGSEIAARMDSAGNIEGDLDSSVRFLVVGTIPEFDPNAPDGGEAAAEAIKQFGSIKARANELGITVIPAWKLQEYLRTIDASLTQPLGTAARASDFEPKSQPNVNRVNTNVAPIYERDDSKLQRGNEIPAP
ncbi:MAG: hypothetical protein AAF664_22085 [Planctomycetota bacterium]